MALELMDEHEQGELVRNWLRQNAVAILVGVVAGLALILGWQQYQSYKRTSSAEAQSGYRAFSAAMDKKDEEAAKKAADALRAGHKDSPYATFAALRQAQSAAEKGDAKAAADALQWAHDNAGLEPLAELAMLRLVRAKIAAGDAEGALALVNKVTDEGYKPVALELRGDALAALGRKDEARAAYEESLTLLDQFSRERNFIEMKRDDLATTAVATAPAKPAAPVAPTTAPAAPSPAASPAADGAKS